MSPSPLYRVGGGGYYLTSYDHDYYGGKTPAYYSRSYWDSLSETTKPFVKIEELDSSTNSVISRKNYAYTPSSLALYSGLGLSSYVSPSSLIYPTTLSDYYPYYRMSTSLWNADPITYSKALLSVPSRYYSPYSYYSSLYTPLRTSLYAPWRRSYYLPVTDMSYYINRLLPYYYHPRPVYHTTYAPNYHYHYDPPRTSVTRTTRSYIVPQVTYTPALTYYRSYSSNYLL